MPITFDVTNLGDATTDPRELHALSYVLSRLACYAEHKARAMEQRAAGDTDAAASFERAADHQYGKLPGWAKW